MIHFTADAKVEIISLLIGRPGQSLRIGVRGGGCSGLQYAMQFDGFVKDGDSIIGVGAYATVFVDMISMMYLDGTTIGYRKDAMGEGFTFNNPNVKTKCGCGNSFSA